MKTLFRVKIAFYGILSIVNMFIAMPADYPEEDIIGNWLSMMIGPLFAFLVPFLFFSLFGYLFITSINKYEELYGTDEDKSL